MMRPERTPISKKPKVPPKPRTGGNQVEVDPVDVYCRIRPPESEDSEICVYPVDYRTLKIVPPITSNAFRNGIAKEQMYKFQKVFNDEQSQKDVFDVVAKPLVGDLLNGKNGLLFAYGVTGSGKTYTMEGLSKDGGIVMRTLDVIFNSVAGLQAEKCIFKPDRLNGFDAQTEKEAHLDRVKAEKEALSDRHRNDFLGPKPTTIRRPVTRRYAETSGGSQDNSLRVPDTSRISYLNDDNVYSIFVSYTEIYNNYVYDLLEEIPINQIIKNLQSKMLLQDAKHNMYINGCTEVEVKNSEEALEILSKGQSRRKVAHTKLNMESSRSHSIFTIRAVQAPWDSQGEEVTSDKNAITVSQLSLVDLAGSERTNRTKATGDRIKEAGNINNSLMNLRTCIEILRENQLNGNSRIIPYRASKLTHFFKNYFEGEGKVNMMVCVNPLADDYDETLPVMKFAQLAGEVQIQKATSVKQDLGLPAGRRKANLMLKEVRKRLQEEGENIQNVETDINIIYSLGPAWPPIAVTSENYKELSSKLLDYLRERINNKRKLTEIYETKYTKFRQCLEEHDKKITLLEKENLSLKAQYTDAMKRVRLLEDRLVESEYANDSIQRKVSGYQNLVDNYQAALEERDMAKTQTEIEKRRLNSRLKAKLDNMKEKLDSEMKNKLKQQKAQLKSQMYAQQRKALDELFSDESFNPEATSTLKKKKSQEKNMKPNTAQTTTRQGTNHRRSRSVGAVTWVDHCPDKVLAQPTTILQPNVPRRKSITRLRSDDLKSDKPLGYCLTTHALASDGEIETNVVKGDVLPTIGGGTQVVFQDLETHRQRDILAGIKRRSDGTPRVDRPTLHDRCAIGIGIATPRPYINKRPRY